MSLDKTIRENLDGKYLTVYSERFKEGIEYAAQINIPQIQLRNSIECSDVDFEMLEKLPALKVISFVGNASKIINVDSIYSLKRIQKFYFQSQQKFQIDISKFPEIKHLGGEYWKGLANFNKAFSLESIVFTKFTDLDLERFSELKRLQVLHIYSSRIQTLSGIEELPIKELTLVRDNSLEDIQAIKDLNSLEFLHIERCKKIVDCETIDFIRNKVNTSIIK